MDEVAVNPAIAIHKWMNVNEPEGQYGGSNHSVQTQRRAAIKGDYAVDQRRQIVGTGADMIGDRKAGLPIMCADESAFFPKAETHKPRVADNDRLQPQQ